MYLKKLFLFILLTSRPLFGVTDQEPQEKVLVHATVYYNKQTNKVVVLGWNPDVIVVDADRFPLGLLSPTLDHNDVRECVQIRNIQHESWRKGVESFEIFDVNAQITLWHVNKEICSSSSDCSALSDVMHGAQKGARWRYCIVSPAHTDQIYTPEGMQPGKWVPGIIDLELSPPPSMLKRFVMWLIEDIRL